MSTDRITMNNNLLQTTSNSGVRHQVRMGSALPDDSLSNPNIQSSIVMYTNYGFEKSYGFEFKTYDTQTNTAGINFINTSNVYNFIKVTNADTAIAKIGLNVNSISTSAISSGNAFIGNVYAQGVSTGALSTNVGYITNLSSVNAIFTAGLSTAAISSGNAFIGNVYAQGVSTASLSTNNAYIRFQSTFSMVIGSTLALAGQVGVDSLSAYDGVRFKDGTGSNELSIFTSTGTNYVDTMLAYVNNSSNVFPMVEFNSNATSSNAIGYLNVLSSISKTVTITHGSLIVPALSTNNISTNFIAAQSVSTGTLSTNAGYITNLSSVSGIFTGGVSTVQISSGNAFIGNVYALGVSTGALSTNTGYITNLSSVSGIFTGGVSTVQISSGNAFIGNVYALGVSTGALSTNTGYITNLSSVSGIFTGGVSTVQISSGNAFIGNVYALGVSTGVLSTNSAYITTLSSQNATIENFSSAISYIGNLYVENIVTTSDVRYKKNVVPLLGALSTVRRLEPVFYDWTGRDNLRAGYQELGFIAQQVEEIIPNVVSIRNDEDQSRAVAYDRLTSLLTGAIRELATRLEEVELRLDAM
jgi:hypothetical protein